MVQSIQTQRSLLAELTAAAENNNAEEAEEFDSYVTTARLKEAKALHDRLLLQESSLCAQLKYYDVLRVAATPALLSLVEKSNAEVATRVLDVTGVAGVVNAADAPTKVNRTGSGKRSASQMSVSSYMSELARPAHDPSEEGDSVVGAVGIDTPVKKPARQIKGPMLPTAAEASVNYEH